MLNVLLFQPLLEPGVLDHDEGSSGHPTGEENSLFYQIYSFCLSLFLKSSSYAEGLAS